MVKKRLIVMLLTFALLLTGLVKASDVGNIIDIEDDYAEIEQTIEQFFSTYAESLTTESTPDFSNCMTNAQAEIYQVIVQYQIDSNKLFEAFVAQQENQIAVIDCSIDNNNALVTIDVITTTVYTDSDDPSISRYTYTFALTKVDSVWEISNIESDNALFANFIAEMQQTFAADTKSEAVQAALIAEDRLSGINDLGTLRYGDSESAESIRKESAIIGIKEATPRTRIKSFDSDTAVAYSDEYAESYASFFHDFKDSWEDCQNFVSQCVWAGYGGWDETDDDVNESNAKNRFRMTSTWYNDGATASSAWKGTNSHWNLVTSNTGNKLGPYAIGYNNGKLYTNLKAASINAGDSVQLSNGNTEYPHTYFVVVSADSYKDIRLNAHTNPRYHVRLSEAITAFGGANCYMRCLEYRSALFDD